MSFFDDLFDRFLGNRSSAQDAKQRLRFVLDYDRAEIPPGMLALIKDDIINVISNRINIDREHVQVNVAQGDTDSKLLVDIPLLPDTSGNQPGRVRGQAQRRRANSTG